MSPRPRVAFATCRQVPALYEEEAELVPRAAGLGIEAQAAVWDDPDVAWGDFDLVVIRSTWDYFERPAEFAAWLERVGARLANAAALVRWNMDKRYLLDLASFGVPVVQTRFVERGARLESILDEEGWTEAVLKPAVSGGAWRTARFTRGEAAAQQELLATITATEPALLQPFLSAIVEEGEWSFFFFGGQPSHAILKSAARGEYRVQTNFGGTARVLDPGPEAWEVARRVERALPLPALYLRVDLVRVGADFRLMEAEAIEPYLFLAVAPEAADRFLAAIAAAVPAR